VAAAARVPVIGAAAVDAPATASIMAPAVAHVKRAARPRRVSEAEVIREAIRAAVGGAKPRPRGGLYSGSESITRPVDELLDRFVER
jgi:hypothetical protein